MKQSLPDNSPQGDREAILARVTEALREEAPRYHEAPEKPAPKGVTAPFREWLPPVGKTSKEQIVLFAKQSEALRTEFCECASVSAAARHIAALAKTFHWKTIALHAGELTDAVAEKLPDTVELLRIDHGYKKEDLEACDAGLTECESLIAQSGSVCVTGRSSGGRALSVLPPHHIVLAYAEQLLPDLTAAYESLAQKYRGKYPSFISFISGPSRTGDIERILVLGAHGPKKLTVLLVPSGS
jgi:L-lactate dehydrogenase complex protein LldG